MRIVHSILVPVTFLLVLIADICRYIYWPEYTGHWSEMVFVLPIQTILPMILLVFPPIYYALNWFGLARLHAVNEITLSKDRPQLTISNNNLDANPDEHKVNWKEILISMKSIIRGKSNLPCRTVELVHVLGSATSVCCLDKKGILSWPLPSIEKVFILANKQKTDAETQPESQLTSIMETGESDDDLDLPIEFNRNAMVEVLDVSHDPRNPYGLIFDDPNWQRHMSSLKPLGLNILLNTCNMDTADRYTQFADHVSVAAHGKADTIAVVNRRCLCELPKQIGFSDEALTNFKLQFDISMYKNVDDQGNRSRILTSKSFIKHKTPMPNMMSVVVREQISSTEQLLTQGTADIMLDLCSDYWDGKDLCPLLDADRKRILDFYHRHSMAAYCTAFSYCPLEEKLSSKLSETYVQLPVGSMYTYPDFNSPIAVKSWDLESLDNKIRKSYVDRRYSIDSALGKTNGLLVQDLDGCIRSQCNQIFIGMVTMQYQAMVDIVQLIEQLDNACIRFVHFSKENELRSRVFSEKMGLESGWNCHISLLSEHADDTSYSDGSHPDIKRGSRLTQRTLSNSSSRRGSSISLVKDYLPRKISAEEDESREELLGSRSKSDAAKSMDSSGEQHCEVRVRSDSRGESMERNVMYDEGIHGSMSVISSQSTDSIVMDTQNRAKLPKGIENIRPHLQNVDNVPLLVSLFTDCNADVTLEMIKIMQENGEIVIVVGSTANTSNIDLFLQADASIGLEPLYPNVCTRIPPALDLLETDHPSPMAMCNKMNGLACSLTFHRNDNLDLRALIVEARAHTLLMRNSFQFYLCTSLALTFLLTISSVLLLPPVISLRHVIWLVIVVIPILSVSLVWHTNHDDRLLAMATAKNRLSFRTANVIEFISYAIFRFLPSIVICILCFGLNLHYLCLRVTENCHHWFGNVNLNGTQNWSGWYSDQRVGFAIAQNFCVCQLVLYFIAISLGFVHRSHLLWRKLPFDNIIWDIAAPALFCIQIIFSSFDILLADIQRNAIEFSVSDVPLASWIIAFVWLLVLVVLSEVIKMREIRSAVRYQKRARLDFGTKLGMNSPF